MKKRILIYGMNYAPEMAGVGRYTGEIGEYLASLGHVVHVITAPAHYPGWRLLTHGSTNRWTKEILAGALVYRCPLYLHLDMHGLRRVLAPLSFALTSFPIALWNIFTMRPDVVLVVEPTLFAAPAALIAAKIVGARTVLHVQDLEIDAAFAVGHIGGGEIISRIAFWLDGIVMRRFDRVITIADAMAKKLGEKGVRSDRIDVVRNWVDLDRIQPVEDASAYRAELGLSDDDFVVLYSGNIGAKQGVRLVVECAKRLADHKQIKFVIAGEGPMRREIEESSAVLANLRVMNFQPEDRFSDFLGIADLHILPQELGTADLLLPSKLGGMLASGRPIVVTANKGTELATFLGETCCLTPAGDAIALSKAILGLVDVSKQNVGREERLKLAARLSKRTAILDFARLVLGLTPNFIISK